MEETKRMRELFVSFLNCSRHDGVPVSNYIHWIQDFEVLFFDNISIFSEAIWRKRTLQGLNSFPASEEDVSSMRSQKIHSTLNNYHDIVSKVWRVFSEDYVVFGDVKHYKHFVIPKKNSVILVGENYIKVWETNRVYFIDIYNHSNKRLMKTLRDIGVTRRAALRILRG